MLYLSKNIKMDIKFCKGCLDFLCKNINEMFLWHSDNYGGEVISNEALYDMSDPRKWDEIEMKIEKKEERRKNKGPGYLYKESNPDRIYFSPEPPELKKWVEEQRSRLRRR